MITNLLSPNIAAYPADYFFRYDAATITDEISSVAKVSAVAEAQFNEFYDHALIKSPSDIRSFGNFFGGFDSIPFF